MELRIMAIAIIAAGLLSSCGTSDLSDAYGQFEADEVTVSAEANGKLLSFDLKEGARLNAGELVGQIDTTALALLKQEMEASVKAVQSRIAQLEAQAEVYEAQLETAEKNRNRLTALKKDNAATQKQLDEVEGSVTTLQRQIDAVQVQKQSVNAEIETIEARIRQVEKQLRDAKIINPVQGTVLNTYAEPFELTSMGRPLYQIADTEELILRVYVSGAQLPQVQLGQEAEVLIDAGEEALQSFKGTVSWISSEAEFTPQMIQTREERVTQMYAVKVRVQNPDGSIKIGMPGEVNF